MTSAETTQMVPCPECGATVGEKCKVNRRPLKRGNIIVHWARSQAATKAAFDAKQPR